MKNQDKKNVDARIRGRLETIRQNKNVDVKIVTELLSDDLSIRESALIRVRELAKMGSQMGQIALEEAIKIKGNLPDCEFYEPHFGVFSGDVIMNADKEILRLAKANKLLEDPKKTQSLISKLFLLDSSIDVMHKIKSIGEEQLHEFQLLGTHLQCRSEQIIKSRGYPTIDG